MITNYEQLVEHQKKFFNKMVEINVNQYEKVIEAIDDFTFGFYSAPLKESIKMSNNFSDSIKL